MAIREARWDCQYCAAKGIAGRHKSCTNCGRSRPEGTKFYLADDDAVVSEAQLLEKAKIGPDWVCQYCGTSNQADAEACRSCGAAREDSSPEQQVREFKPEEAPKTGDMTLEPEPRAASSSAARPKSERRRSASPLAIIGVVGALLLLCIGVVAALAVFGGKDVEATVAGFSWERTVEIEALRSVTEEDWSVPPEGRIIDQRQEIHHYDQVLVRYETREREVAEQVQVGERTYVCGQRDLGNGFFEDIQCSEPVFETQYRTETSQEPVFIDEPVYRTKYTYAIDRWVGDRIETETGSDRSPAWPAPQLASNEREGQRSELYIVFFTDSEGASHSQEMTLEEWFDFESGQRVGLKFDTFGNLTGVER